MFDRSVSTRLPTECEIQDPMAVTAHKAGAEHDIGPAVENRLEELSIVGWVVFQIGILYEDHIAGRMVEPSAKRCVSTAIDKVSNLRAGRGWRGHQCIAYAATTFRSSPLRMRDGGRDTGGRVNPRFWWFEKLVDDRTAGGRWPRKERRVGQTFGRG